MQWPWEEAKERWRAHKGDNRAKKRLAQKKRWRSKGQSVRVMDAKIAAKKAQARLDAENERLKNERLAAVGTVSFMTAPVRSPLPGSGPPGYSFSVPPRTTLVGLSQKARLLTVALEAPRWLCLCVAFPVMLLRVEKRTCRFWCHPLGAIVAEASATVS